MAAPRVVSVTITRLTALSYVERGAGLAMTPGGEALGAPVAPSRPGQTTDSAGIGVRCEGVVHLYKTFEGHDVVALQGVDLVVQPGERVAFLGPSGSGKSTLLTLFGGIQRPSAGRIFIGDDEISRMSERQLTRVRASRVSTMLQGATRNLLPYATTRQNLGFAQLATRTSGPRRPAMSDAELLSRVGLAEQSDQVVSTLSGGQRQRLALACAVTSSPSLLLADEPTSQLSHEDRDHMLELIHGLGDEFGTTILVVTHQPEVADTFPRTVTMRGGRVGSEGRDGAEYVVVGADGVVHLPAHVAREWPPGTLVRIEPETQERLVLSRPSATVETDEQ
jgi:ABC-type lipoprotein export system ATPase subunit